MHYRSEKKSYPSKVFYRNICSGNIDQVNTTHAYIAFIRIAHVIMYNSGTYCACIVFKL